MTVCSVDQPALVLGSTQPASAFVASPAVPVVRRRSGGGAVLVEPGRLVWVEVIVPVGDPLWQADVGRASWWLGRAWALALADLGVGGAEVHMGGLVRSEWSSLVCFAGLGPGEVTVGGRKVVGLAQRRARAGAVFQCAVPLAWRPADLVGLLALSAAEAERALADLGPRVLALGGREEGAVVDALVARLP